MSYEYTINDIQTKCKVSLQSLYTFIKKNKDFINENSTRKQRKIYYNQAALDFFVSYYKPEEAPEEPQKAEEQAAVSTSADSRIKELEAANEALKAEISTLKSQLESKEAERIELLRQNGALILTLQQEKQEKMLLLPAPKKSISEKVKSLFKGKAQE